MVSPSFKTLFFFNIFSIMNNSGKFKDPYLKTQKKILPLTFSRSLNSSAYEKWGIPVQTFQFQ